MNFRTFFKSFLVFLFLGMTSMVTAADIVVAPVPWIPEDNHTATGNLTDGISFRNLPDRGDIYIYSINGYQVRHIEFNNVTTHRASWLGDTDDGTVAASGVYLWLVKSSELTKTGKLIVVR